MNLVDFHHHSVYDLGHLRILVVGLRSVELKTKAKALQQTLFLKQHQCFFQCLLLCRMNKCTVLENPRKSRILQHCERNELKIVKNVAFQLLTTLVSREKLSKNKLGENLVKMLWVWHFLAIDNFDFPRILSGQKFIKNAKNRLFWRVFENLKLAVKQCYQTGQF